MAIFVLRADHLFRAQDTRMDRSTTSIPVTTGSTIPFWPTIWAIVKPYRRRLMVSVGCAMVVGVAFALQPVTVKWIVDNGVLRKAADGTLAPLAERLRYALIFVALYFGLSAVRMGVGVTGMMFMIDGIERFVADLRARFFRHVQRLSFSFHDQVSSGELFNYIMGSPLQSLKQFLHDGALMIPLNLVGFTVTVATLTAFHPLMALITVLMIVTVVAVNRRSAVVVREYSAEFMNTESSVSKYVADMLRGARAVKTYAIEREVVGSFEHQVQRMRSEGARLAKRRTLEHAKAESMQYAGMAVVYGAGAYLCLYRDMQVGTFFAFVVSIGSLMHSLMAMLQLNLVKANAEAGLTRIVRVLQQESDTPDPRTAVRAQFDHQKHRARSEGAACVEMRGVRFAYDPLRVVLDDVNCVVPDGQSVALVGPSGSGKTTFVSLLLRLRDVQQGTVLVNGLDVRTYPLGQLRSSFGVVPQDPYIFQGTILDNIRVIDPEASDEDVRRAMEAAYVTEFVNELPQGLQTQVGEGGAGLSGGQRQRVAIARAVLSRPDYYIFDEATSALDNESERRIQAAMDRMMKGHTTFIIAHRLSTVRNVDRVLVFNRGRIVQDGTFDQLSQEPGLFRELLRSAEDAGHASRIV